MLYTVEVITSLLDVGSEICRRRRLGSAVVTDEHSPPRLQPFVKPFEECRFVLSKTPIRSSTTTLSRFPYSFTSFRNDTLLVALQ